MKRRRGGSLWWFVFLAALAGALWFRLRHRGDSPPPPARPVPPVSAAVVPDAALPDAAKPLDPPAPVEPAARPPAAPPYSSAYNLIALSSDGKRALLSTEVGRTSHLRVIDIESGAVKADLDLHAFAHQIEHERPPELVDELVQARSILRGFPLGAAGELAASPDGTAGAFNEATDDLVTMRGDAIGAKIPQLPAAYTPLAAPDNKTLLFSGYDGRIDGEGVYALFWSPLDKPAPHKIADTDDYTGRWAVSRAGDAVRIEVTQPGDHRTCILEVPLTRPYRVTRRRCVDGAERDGTVMSPSGDWVAWIVRAADPHHVRAMNLATGEVAIDAPIDAVDVVVGDTGLVVAQDRGAAHVLDPVTHAVRPIELADGLLRRCLARGDHELVCEHDGAVDVVDVATLP